jgi:outer membrane protein assembly factor BamE (lipoprotein component of BamABCDE complex)
MKKLSIVVMILAVVCACSSQDVQNEQSVLITQNQVDQIEHGMTYVQITSILGSPGEQEGVPKSLLFWFQDGCHLKVMLDENMESGTGTFSWCDEVCEEKDGETWCKSDVPNLFADKINSKMTYQEIVKAVGEPNEKQEVLVYKWEGVEGARKHKITVYFADNIAFQVFKISMEDAKDKESVEFKF